jgi:hypothetical protein
MKITVSMVEKRRACRPGIAALRAVGGSVEDADPALWESEWVEWLMESGLLRPCDDSRRLAIEAGLAHYYARFVDKGPHDDTREAAIKDGKGHYYARYIGMRLA